MTSWLILQVIWDLKSASYALAIITIVLVNDHINFLNKQKWIKLIIENNRKIMQPVWQRDFHFHLQCWTLFPGRERIPICICICWNNISSKLIWSSWKLSGVPKWFWWFWINGSFSLNSVTIALNNPCETIYNQ